MDAGTIIKVALVGIAAQVVDGTLGMGHGVACASMLVYAGIAPVVVSSTVHMSEIVTTLCSGLSHVKFGNVDKRLFFRLMGFGMAGGIAGALLLVKLSVFCAQANEFMSAVLLGMGCLIIMQFLAKQTLIKQISVPTLGLLGLLAGFASAIGGGGWGAIMTSSLTIGSVEPRKAVGTVNLAKFFVTVSIVITFLATVGIKCCRWDIALILAGVAVPVAVLGAYLCSRIPNRILGILVGSLLILINLKTLLTTWIH